MPLPDIHRCVRCRSRLARDNPGPNCSACAAVVVVDRQEPPKEVPASFWEHPAIVEAVRARHMGRLIAAYRHHPYHGTPIVQTIMAGWAHLTQAQISRLERRSADQQLDRLTFWARLLQIPETLLWFTPQGAVSAPGPSVYATRLAAEPARLYGEAVPPNGRWTAEENDDMRRRTILASLIAVVTSPFGTAAPLGDSDLDQLSKLVTKVRSAYQHSRYERALRDLPSVLSALAAAAGVTPDDDRIAVLTAEAYQVASGLLLKSDDPLLAAVAAERSIVAARASGQPLIVASSSRAVAHGLLAGGYPDRAAEVATAAADRLTIDVAMRSAQDFSVYGALLLRGAIAAARAENREQAGALLDEATAAAQHIGRDENACWTAFGPTNVLAHRVAVAVELGDAGTAVDLAGTVDLSTMAVPERRAMLMLDTARALTQWGKYERALDAVRMAEQHAPEEVRTRRSVHQLINDLGRRCPVPLQRRVHDYARSVGAMA
ncbi:hypothetical protein [Dactylosporangium sp. CA-152071]|uniref:hypothetical protein n=1 Tax=Dactylosporangium sp. CA-152071 TaxID=3239933 RepID=UPI003D8A258C